MLRCVWAMLLPTESRHTQTPHNNLFFIITIMLKNKKH